MTTSPTAQQGASSPPGQEQYWDLNGQPLRRRHPLALVEALTPGGQWVPFLNPKALWTEAQPLDRHQARLLEAEWLGWEQE